MFSYSFRPIAAAAAVLACSISFVGCTTSGPQDRGTIASEHGTVDAQIEATVSRLYRTVPGTREMATASKGILIFPSVVGGSWGIGAEYGRGALQTQGVTRSYYRIVGGSIGWQAGIESKAIIYMFNTQDALDKFLASKGWTVGVDATVSIANIGANGTIDTETLRAPVTSFVLANAGLEVGASLQGMKITKSAP